MWRRTLLPITSCYALALACCAIWAAIALATWDQPGACEAILQGNAWALVWPVGLLADFALRFSGHIEKHFGQVHFVLFRYLFVFPGMPSLVTLIFALMRGAAFVQFNSLPVICSINLPTSYGLQLTCVLLAVTMLPYFAILYRDELCRNRQSVGNNTVRAGDNMA